MRSEVKAARLIKDETQAYYIANAGVFMGFKKLVASKTDHIKKEEDQELIWRVNTDIKPQNFGNGFYKIKIGNESGKINLNYAKRDLLKLLFTSLNVEEERCDIIVDSILDWRDADALHRLKGAENDYYQSLPEPYKCRDGFFRYKDELLMVKGITKELYESGLKNFISIVIISKSPGKYKNRAKRGHININAAPLELLKIFPGMTSEIVKDIAKYRQKKDITSLHDLITITGPEITVDLKKNIDYHYNNFYTFDVEGWTIDEFTKQRVLVMIEKTRSKGAGYKIVQWIDSVPQH